MGKINKKKRFEKAKREKYLSVEDRLALVESKFRKANGYVPTSEEESILLKARNLSCYHVCDRCEKRVKQLTFIILFNNKFVCLDCVIKKLAFMNP